MTKKMLRKQLCAQLDGGQAYLPLQEAIREFPAELAGSRLPAVTHTAWQLLEHMRIAQADILQFVLDPGHVSPKWPEEFWPTSDGPEPPNAWERSVDAFFADLGAVKALAMNADLDLLSAIPHGTGQTYLREILLVADHNAYHLGQFMLVRRGLGA